MACHSSCPIKKWRAPAVAPRAPMQARCSCRSKPLGSATHVSLIASGSELPPPCNLLKPALCDTGQTQIAAIEASFAAARAPPVHRTKPHLRAMEVMDGERGRARWQWVVWLWMCRTGQ